MTTTDTVLEPGRRAVLGTGVAIALPEGYAGFVHSRSGLAARAGLAVLNAPGTLDAGYRGEVMVCLINHGSGAVALRRGDRIAQLVVQRVARAEFVEVTADPEVTSDTGWPTSRRGSGGFGSTGGWDAAAHSHPPGSGDKFDGERR